ncbi:addiction module antidote protein, HigA family [Rhizobium ruizarguesonis]|uniref:HigA family addiction module antitoxin n=1 Tax=Rhizobium ruizarguesonis TaxID=2081791 RepID=UPI00103258AA|nr:HigA family addiction module antitoxin [Rhizobium ruizarguesonis]TAY24446.1 addiction module antidote protein, HigA family [Rhizobium ruizarguesonis]
MGNDVPHPGTRIKAEVIPKGMSVTRAAEFVGVGRPALSNLLNGNAALSAEMATRLEKAFNYPREDLLEMQAKYEEAQAKRKNAPTETKAYVPTFHQISANQIESWVDHNITARIRFAVLLRTLVHSTTSALTKVDFPGNDDAERPGWDGFVEAQEGTSWVPEGRSGWEFGTNEDIKTKADGDFEKSVNAVSGNEREDTTFVFVTPRRWPGKTAWVAASRAKRLWKDVRAYDSSDIEQWIEQSLPAQTWLANEIKIPSQDVRSLDKCWSDWADVAEPVLRGELFQSAIEASKRTIVSRLKTPADGPTIIAADSTEEALAFLAQLLGEAGGEELGEYRDRVLVFDKPGVLPRLAQGAESIIPVVFTREVERELGPYAKSMRAIIVYPRNATTAEPHVVLEPASYDTFNRGLEAMGCDRDTIARLVNETGRSLTVLRRRLATVPAVQSPQWAIEREIAESLVPFLFVGTWNAAVEADRLGLSWIAGDRPYVDLEKVAQKLAQLNDAPIWSIGTYRGVVSKIDLLYAVANSMTTDDLKQYFSVARLVLGEDDPALDLEEDKRWAASFHGKEREFSNAFREGISETLVLLAIHGRHLFRSRFEIDTEVEAARVVRDLLPTPLTTRTLEANDRDLPTYAEASPEEFLSILEDDLRRDEPAVLGLLRPAASGFFGHPSRTGLLWALESLSWNPTTLPRTASILARLAQVEINDNWVNKPAHSLESIFRAWMPQTAATHEQRVELMKKLAQRYPEVAWKLCVAQFSTRNQVGDYSHKPRWRPDGYGFGEPFPTWPPVMAFVREMVEMALTWNGYSLSMLCDLVERLHELTDTDQERVWTLVENWSESTGSDVDKAALREKIRITVLSRRAALRAKKDEGQSAALGEKARAVYDALQPQNVLNKHGWLFRESWVDESADEVHEIDKIDFEARNKRIEKLRVDAMREVQKECGLRGLLELATRGNASWMVGGLAASEVLSETDLHQFVRLALQLLMEEHDSAHIYRALIAGALRTNLAEEKREQLLRSVGANLNEEGLVQLFILAPYRRSTWRLVDTLAETARRKYWQEVVPDWIHDSEEENNESVESLLRVSRPRAAFSCVRYSPERLDAQMLFRILSDAATGGDDKPNEYMLEEYSVGQAFKHIDASPNVPADQKAILEFAYLEILAKPFDDRSGGPGIPNLEYYIQAHPEIYVQAISWTYKRKDGGVDPEGLQLPNDRQKGMAERGYKLLEAIRRIPGYDPLGKLETERLAKWIETVRGASAELSRGDIADFCIGRTLANSPIGEDGTWPCEAVRDVMEDVQSKSMMEGARNGVYNSRGVHWRGEGGDQERELADKYRRWADALRFSHPFVSSQLLMALTKTYEREANNHDTEAGIRRRMR